MPLWGGSSADESKPKWLTIDQKANTFATNSGWVYRHPSGDEEVIACGKNFATIFVEPTITKVRLRNRSTAASPFVFVVSYNEEVSVNTASGLPYFEIEGDDDSLAANAFFTSLYPASLSASQSLIFTYTPAANTSVNANIAISSVSILANGASIVDAINTSVSANLSMTLAGADELTDVRPTISTETINTY